LVYDHASRRVERHFLSLAGTMRNCAGGSTPWGSWITSEEATDRADDIFQQDHGYNFEVPATPEIAIADPRPLREMGRFRHEAVAVDPGTGIVYQTEDMDDGLIYRFLPNESGKLAAGGRLQALVVRDRASCDTRNWKRQSASTTAPGSDLAHGRQPVRSLVAVDARPIPAGTRLDVRWIDLDDVEAPRDDLRYRGFELGAARFARGEGMWFGTGAVYFACTTGGDAGLGQIWRYVPSPHEGQDEEDDSPGRLELFIEPNDGQLIENCDNLTVAPWGDLVITEDGPEEQYVLGVTPAGQIYRIGRNALNHSELAGATFSPDGSTLFVNIYDPGLTLAISGPWHPQT
jgi:secreted PhoX family phosphatase